METTAEEAQRVVMMETTAEEAQRVVMIQDASREVSVNVVKWILDGFSLKSGDSLTLLSVLHQVNNPMGYKIRLDSSIFGANKKVVDDEIERKKKDYEDDIELDQISKLYEMQKIEFKMEVHAGPSPKIAALEAAKKLCPTWVILDRQLKKDKGYFLERLSCGISRMKRDNNLEKLRGPKPQKTGRSCSERRFSFSTHISYDEMLPGSAEDEDDDLFSIELFPTNSASSLGSTESARSSLSEVNSEKKIKETTMLLREETNSIREKFPFESNGKGRNQKPTLISSTENVMGSMKPEEETVVNNLICTVCKNARPIIGFESREFSFAKLHYATNGFSRENLISSREYESVFRGKLKSRLKIAVKQQRDVISSIEEKKFKSEVQTLEKMQHKNVVMLLGTYSGKNQRLLVYEYVCNGSLDQHISGQGRSPLTWEARMNIAAGISKGLNHLHKNKIIHRDVTAKNILLTHDFEPVLGGFGLARTLLEATQTLDRHVVGSFGYLAPEYAESGKATTKTDVYSFGVVLLQLITGRSIQDERLEEKSLLQWARPLLKEMKCSELIDPRIASSRDPHQLMSMVQVIKCCLSNNPQQRLSMDKVISTLEAGPDEDGEVRTILLEKNALATPLPKQAKHFFL